MFRRSPEFSQVNVYFVCLPNFLFTDLLMSLVKHKSDSVY